MQVVEPLDEGFLCDQNQVKMMMMMVCGFIANQNKNYHEGLKFDLNEVKHI